MSQLSLKIYASFPCEIRFKLSNFMAFDNVAPAYTSWYILSPKHDVNLHLCQLLFLSPTHSLTLIIARRLNSNVTATRFYLASSCIIELAQCHKQKLSAKFLKVSFQGFQIGISNQSSFSRLQLIQTIKKKTASMLEKKNI